RDQPAEGGGRAPARHLAGADAPRAKADRRARRAAVHRPHLRLAVPGGMSMEKAAIRSAQPVASTNPVARNAAARQAAGPQAADAQGGFSLLLADMAAPAAGPLAGAAEDPLAGADPLLAALPGQELVPVDTLPE